MKLTTRTKSQGKNYFLSKQRLLKEPLRPDLFPNGWYLPADR
jgi:hypothetical protein